MADGSAMEIISKCFGKHVGKLENYTKNRPFFVAFRKSLISLDFRCLGRNYERKNQLQEKPTLYKISCELSAKKKHNLPKDENWNEFFGPRSSTPENSTGLSLLSLWMWNSVVCDVMHLLSFPHPLHERSHIITARSRTICDCYFPWKHWWWLILFQALHVPFIAYLSFRYSSWVHVSGCFHMHRLCNIAISMHPSVPQSK